MSTPQDLAARIIAEVEHRLPADPKLEMPGKSAKPARKCILEAEAVLQAARGKGGKIALAYSGGVDSTAVLHLAVQTGLKPTILWADTGMEYPETRPFIKKQAERYNLPLAIASAPRAPEDQWRRTGWPMLGKMASRAWTAAHPDAGFRLNVSECCRDMKIRPARTLARNLGCTVQITGQRGKADDRIRAMHAITGGALSWQHRDRLWIANPLSSWTDNDVVGYAAEHNLPEHPTRARGAKTIGCVFCGGGSQFDNSGYRVLRKTWPEAWRWFIVDLGAGHIILALKYRARLEAVQRAIKDLGGLEVLAVQRPWIFDYTRKTPIPGYRKVGAKMGHIILAEGRA